jgi:hypothetical protein
MLGLLAQKQQLADGVLDGLGDLKSMALPSGRAAFIARLEELMGMDLRGISTSVRRREQARAAPKDDPYEAFRDDLLARFPERVLMVESQPNGVDRDRLLVVVDRDTERLEPLTRRLLRESFREDSGRPALELLDRATYETIQRLIREGFLKAGDKPGRRIHCDPALEDGREETERRRRAEAWRKLSLADRKLRMARLLAEGGFGLEAAPAWSEALRKTLGALAAFHGAEVAQSEPDGSLEAIEARLAGLGVSLPKPIAAATARIAGTVRESGETDEETAGELMRSGKRVFDYVVAVVGPKPPA